MTIYDDTTPRPSTPSLISAALAQLSRLIESEIRLAKAEFGEKLSTAVKAVLILVISLFLVLLALIFLLMGVAQLLVYFGLQPFVASFIVGIVIAIVAAVASWLAIRSVAQTGLLPNRTITQLRRTTDVLKDELT